jgi:Sugar kinases, ribokinase family
MNDIITSNHRRRILCVGICTLDTIATLDEFPSPNSKVRSNSPLCHFGGGNAANTAVAISRLGQMQVDLATAVGDDSNGDTILQQLSKESNVGLKHVQRYHGDSPWSYILVTKDGTRTIIHQPSLGELTEEYVEQNVNLREYCAVHFDGRYPTAAVSLSKKCVELGIPYSVDVERPREGLLELMAGASVIICNSDYCSLALGLSNEKVVAVVGDDQEEKEAIQRFQQVFRNQAPKAVMGVMTMGSSGSYLLHKCTDYNADDLEQKSALMSFFFDNNKKYGSPRVQAKHSALWCEAYPPDPSTTTSSSSSTTDSSSNDTVDTTGAGDAFQGGFLTALWGIVPMNVMAKIGGGECHDATFMASALRLATRVAWKKIQQPGARQGLPYYEEDQWIRDEIKQVKSLFQE